MVSSFFPHLPPVTSLQEPAHTAPPSTILTPHTHTLVSRNLSLEVQQPLLPCDLARPLSLLTASFLSPEVAEDESFQSHCLLRACAALKPCAWAQVLERDAAQTNERSDCTSSLQASARGNIRLQQKMGVLFCVSLLCIQLSPGCVVLRRGHRAVCRAAWSSLRNAH